MRVFRVEFRDNEDRGAGSRTVAVGDDEDALVAGRRAVVIEQPIFDEEIKASDGPVITLHVHEVWHVVDVDD